jgi:hypothetical protein
MSSENIQLTLNNVQTKCGKGFGSIIYCSLLYFHFHPQFTLGKHVECGKMNAYQEKVVYEFSIYVFIYLHLIWF